MGAERVPKSVRYEKAHMDSEFSLTHMKELLCNCN